MNKLMVIRWIDAASDGDSWESMKELEKNGLLPCCSVGWIAKETEDFIHLVPNIGVELETGESSGFGGISIPIVSIVSTQEIEGEDGDDGDECD